MTIESPYTIDTTEIEDGQAPGSIVPGRIRIITDSLAGIPFSTNSPQTGSYTATIQDKGAVINFNATTDMVYTVPPNGSVAFDVGTLLICRQIGAGRVSFSQGSGVTFSGPKAKTFTTAQIGSTIYAHKTATDAWNIFGDLAGRFYVQAGQIIDPNGKPFIAKGINAAGWTWQASGGTNGTDNGVLISKMFPNINIVRLNCQGTATDAASGLAQFSGNDSVASLATYVTNLTSQKIVVLVENHDTTQTVYTGATLTAESAWYASWAAAYVNNEYVWFATMNEPTSPGAQGLVTTQQVATYNAIRTTSNNRNPILLAGIGGYCVTLGGSPLTYASYLTMTNVIWDTHFYDWIPTNGVAPFTTSWALLQAALTTQIANFQAVTSADGIVPVIIGEYGISTGGGGVDPGGTQTVMVCQDSGYGCIAWTWAAGASDRLQNNGVITGYGNEVSGFIAGSPTAGGTLGSTIYSTQAANPVSIANASTVDVMSLQGPPVATFTAGPYFALNVTVRNQTNSACFSASWMVSITRGSGSATIATSAVFGEIGTAGTITMAGAGTIRITFTTVSADASAYHITLQNTSADIYQVWFSITPSVLSP